MAHNFQRLRCHAYPWGYMKYKEKKTHFVLLEILNNSQVTTDSIYLKQPYPKINNKEHSMKLSLWFF